VAQDFPPSSVLLQRNFFHVSAFNLDRAIRWNDTGFFEGKKSALQSHFIQQKINNALYLEFHCSFVFRDGGRKFYATHNTLELFHGWNIAGVRFLEHLIINHIMENRLGK
jgi:hypothetical protein